MPALLSSRWKDNSAGGLITATVGNTMEDEASGSKATNKEKEIDEEEASTAQSWFPFTLFAGNKSVDTQDQNKDSVKPRIVDRKKMELFLFNKMTGDMYVKYRLIPLLEYYRQRGQKLSATTNSMEAFTIFFTAIGSVFSLFKADILIPVTVAIGSLFASIKSYKAYDKVSRHLE